jgi:hypothetical protein
MEWKEEAFKRIDAIAEKLGVAASEVWGVLIKQAVVDGKAFAYEAIVLIVIASSLLGVTAYAIFSKVQHTTEVVASGGWESPYTSTAYYCTGRDGCFAKAQLSNKQEEPTQRESKDWTYGQMIKAAIGVVCAIAGSILLGSGFESAKFAYRHLGNPKYWAIQDVLDAID